MAESVVGAEVEVTVTLKITPSDTWGENTSVKQIRDQARTAAMSMLHKVWQSTERVTTLKAPEITAIHIVSRP
jgi:hypothetical protein